MKYFTREWVSGSLTDEDWKKSQVLYLKHLDFILPRCSASVVELAKDISLHDGLIRRCIIDRRAAQLNLVLRCGDLQSGYFDISLQYLQVEFSMDKIVCLAKLARSCQVELLYDEIDLDENSNYVHSLIFSSFDEISINFSALKIKKEKQPDRSLPFEGDRFQDKSW